MIVKDQHDSFLAYYEGRLSHSELEKFESSLKDPQFREDYDFFVKSKQAIEYSIGEDLKQSLEKLSNKPKIRWFTPKLRKIAAVFVLLIFATFYFLHHNDVSQIEQIYVNADLESIRGNEAESSIHELRVFADSLFKIKEYANSLDQWNTLISQYSDDTYHVHLAERNKVVLLWLLKDPEALVLLDKIIAPVSNHEQKDIFGQKEIKILRKLRK
jgi:hypothetical protein